MRSVRAGVSALAVSSVLITAIGPGTTTATTPSSPESTLRDYCVTCHSQRLRTGGLSIEGLDLANVAHDAETGEVVRKLRLGTMPPLGARRPDRAAYDNAIDWLEEKLDAAGTRIRIPAARAAPAQPGRAPTRSGICWDSTSTSRCSFRRMMPRMGSTTWPTRSAVRRRCCRRTLPPRGKSARSPSAIPASASAATRIRSAGPVAGPALEGLSGHVWRHDRAPHISG